MPDAKFVWKGVKHSSLAFAAKKAVLWPLTRRRSLRNAEVLRDLQWLQRFWRDRLLGFKTAGWADVNSPGKLQFCRNCPPEIGIAVGEKVYRPCNMWQVCPWCHSRHMRVVFDVLARLVPAHGKLSTPIRLVEIRNKTLRSLKDVGKMLNPALSAFKKSPVALIDRLKPLGAYYNVQVEPRSVKGQRDMWSFTYHVVALVPPDWERPEWLTTKGRKVIVTDVYSKKQLINVAARTCRYSVGLLRGNIKLAIKALNARRGTKSSAMLGCFRTKRTVET